MDLGTVIGEISEVKRETLVSIAKKVALPLTLLPLLWMVFLRKTGMASRGKVVRKPDANDGNALEDISAYNLRNLVGLSRFGLGLVSGV